MDIIIHAEESGDIVEKSTNIGDSNDVSKNVQFVQLNSFNKLAVEVSTLETKLEPSFQKMDQRLESVLNAFETQNRPNATVTRPSLPRFGAAECEGEYTDYRFLKRRVNHDIS